MIELSDALADAAVRAESSVVRVDGGRRRSLSGTVFSEDEVIVTALHGLRARGRHRGLRRRRTRERELGRCEPALDLAVLRAERKLGKVPEFVADNGSSGAGSWRSPVSRPGRSPRVALGVDVRARG